MALETADTFTEVVITELHDSAQRVVTGRRPQRLPGLGAAGMLLATGARLEIQDRLARGLAERTFVVVPRRFVGERLALPETAGGRVSLRPHRALSGARDRSEPASR
jgi:hypothetical protein